MRVADLLPKNSKLRAEQSRAKQHKSRAIDDLVYEEGVTSSGTHGPIPTEIRKAVVIDRAKGVPSKIVARKYEISVGSVQHIWREFSSTLGTHISEEDDPIKFKSRIRKKAIDAIENGLDFGEDPYRQASIGIKVMEGIGEFKGDKTPADVQFNLFLSGVPAEWRDKYLGIEVASEPPLDIPASASPVSAITDGGVSEIDEIDKKGSRG